MRKSILTILFPLLLLSCNMLPAKEGNKQDNTMQKSYIATGESIGECLDRDKQPGMCAKQPMAADGIVRLSKIEVYPQYLDEYMKYASEVGEVSLRTESGVLTMYAVSEKANPCKVTILETYASREAYEKHIASEHFQKYKQGTLHMVKSLELADQTPINPANIINNFIQ